MGFYKSNFDKNYDVWFSVSTNDSKVAAIVHKNYLNGYVVSGYFFVQVLDKTSPTNYSWLEISLVTLFTLSIITLDTFNAQDRPTCHNNVVLGQNQDFPIQIHKFWTSSLDTHFPVTFKCWLPIRYPSDRPSTYILKIIPNAVFKLPPHGVLKTTEMYIRAHCFTYTLAH